MNQHQILNALIQLEHSYPVVVGTEKWAYPTHIPGRMHTGTVNGHTVGLTLTEAKREWHYYLNGARIAYRRLESALATPKS